MSLPSEEKPNNGFPDNNSEFFENNNKSSPAEENPILIQDSREKIAALDKIPPMVRQYVIYNQNLKAYVIKEDSMWDTLLADLKDNGYKLVMREMYDSRIILKKGKNRVTFYRQDSNMRKNLQYVHEHKHWGKKLKTPWPWSYKKLLSTLNKEFHNTPKVLYLGSGGDRSIERSFENTTNFDRNEEFMTNLKGKTIAGDILTHDFGEEKFDIIVFRHMPQNIFEDAEICEKLKSLLGTNGIILQSVSSSKTELYEHKMIRFGGLERARDVFSENGFIERPPIKEQSDFEKIYSRD